MLHATEALRRSVVTLQRLTVWPTLEVMVTATPAHSAKTIDPETGLAVIDLCE